MPGQAVGAKSQPRPTAAWAAPHRVHRSQYAAVREDDVHGRPYLLRGQPIAARIEGWIGNVFQHDAVFAIAAFQSLDRSSAD